MAYGVNSQKTKNIIVPKDRCGGKKKTKDKRVEKLLYFTQTDNQIDEKNNNKRLKKNIMFFFRCYQGHL